MTWFPRREFLSLLPASVLSLGAHSLGAQSLGAQSLSAPLLAAQLQDSKPADPEFQELETEADWKAVRERFSFDPDWTYFNSGGLGPVPTAAQEAVCDTVRKLQHRTEHGHALIEEVRPLLAELLGAKVEEVAFTRNATEGNSAIASGLKLQSGEEVILDSHAHQGGSVCWMTRERFEGIKIRSFDPMCESGGEILDRIRRLITPSTRVVQVSHVTAPTGIHMPVKEIAELAHRHGLWFHIDGAQSLGMLPLNVQELGCDSFASSGHKWLGGPTGTGALFVRRDRLDEVQPTNVGSYGCTEWRIPDELVLAKSARRFECGTRDAAIVVGLGEAMKLMMSVGIARAWKRGRQLAEYARQQLQSVEGVEVISPKNESLRSSMISFRKRDLPNSQVFGALYKAGIRCRPVNELDLNAVRVSTHVYNSRQDVDQLIQELRRLTD